MSEQSEPSADGALGSVRELETALQAADETRVANETRLDEARSEASQLVAAAQAEADAAASERRRAVLAAAEDDVNEIHRQGEENAARLRADARRSRAATVEAALALILPTGDESEA